MRFLLFLVVSAIVGAGESWAASFHQLSWFGPDASAVVGMSFLNSNTSYETESGSSFAFDRKMFGVDAGFNMGDDVAVFGQFGRAMSVELEDVRDLKGDGYSFGFGAKTIAYSGTKAMIIPYGVFNYITEEMKYKVPNTDDELKADVSMYEFTVGVIFALNTNPNFKPYAGFELFPLNEGKMKFDDTTATVGTGTKAIKTDTEKYKRDDVIALKFGAAANFANFVLRGEATMISETTFLFGAGFLF